MANPYLAIGGALVAVFAAGIGVFMAPGWVAQMQDNEAQSDVKLVLAAQQTYYNDYGEYATSLEELNAGLVPQQQVSVKDGAELESYRYEFGGTSTGAANITTGVVVAMKTPSGRYIIGNENGIAAADTSSKALNTAISVLGGNYYGKTFFIQQQTCPSTSNDAVALQIGDTDELQRYTYDGSAWVKSGGPEKIAIVCESGPLWDDSLSWADAALTTNSQWFVNGERNHRYDE